MTTAAPRSMIEPEHWGERLRILADKYGVPGASLGILRVGGPADGSEDAVATVATGVLNTATRVEATTDSVFQIGSISKVWTTTLAMQLVDEGLIDLDTPVADVLPALVLSDSAATRSVTLRHLLSHTSGIDGDAFIDTGRGSDAVEKFAARLASQPQVFPPGERYSYCNAGFGLVGRIVEVLTGVPWDVALRERLIDPLGVTHTSSMPEDAILHRVAVGHVAEPGASVAPTRQWMFPRCAGPAGLVNSTVADLLAFARMHLCDGVHTDGVRIVSTRSSQAMREPQVDVPDGLAVGGARGLGWNMSSWDGHRVFGHDGAVIGQYAFLDVIDDAGIAVALLTNGPGADNLWLEVRSEIFEGCAGITVPSVVEPDATSAGIDGPAYEGTYVRTGHRIVISADRDALTARVTDDWGTVYGPSTYDVELLPAGAGLFVYRLPGDVPWSAMRFGQDSSGRDYVYHLHRVNRRYEVEASVR